ncbi:hypothetical protein [Shinella sp.]|uniref:hypothetical protein n=1 Tax=Shinella sp. TaxID=1870904 RepID=UPI00301CEC3B
MTDSSTPSTTAFQSFEHASEWALAAVDEGRLDRTELYEFHRDLLEGKDMAAWHQEDAIRRGGAAAAK